MGNNNFESPMFNLMTIFNFLYFLYLGLAALIDLERFKQIFKDLDRSLFDNDELKSAAKLIFSQFDSDKSGFLACTELKRLLESENLYFKPEFDRLVKEFSGNEEKLTFDYFWEMIVQLLRR